MTILTSVNMHYRKALVAASDKLSRQLSNADQKTLSQQWLVHQKLTAYATYSNV